MSVLKTLVYCELDLKRCSLTYGVAPCTATIDGSPQTGTFKCYNSPNTCQDAANFAASTLTLRFAISTDYLPPEISCIPSIRSVSTKAQVLNPGESLGERESVTVTFNDHPFNDVGIDKYHAERGFDPYQRGTFWSKFAARWPYIQGSALRIIRGFEGDALEDMETRHYVVESQAGPDANGTFSIVAKDVIKLLDGEKAQAPRASTGVLSAAIDDNDTSVTLEPAGVGDAEYPASGIASIGDEQVSFTRVGDVFTIVRGLDFSEAGSHEEGETFQLGIFYDGEDASDIIYDLMTEYSDVEAAMIALADWQFETNNYIGHQYSRKILKPASVKELVNQLINQVGLLINADTLNRKIILRALRQFIPLSQVNDDIIIEDTFDIDEQPDKRVSEVWTYIGQKNPLEAVDKEENYRTIVIQVASNSVATLEARQNSIRKIYSPWISVFNRPAAESLNNIIIQRYQNAPRRFRYQLPITESPVLASAATVSNRNIQDAQGSPGSAVAQLISIDKSEARYTITAEEMTFVQQVATDHVIKIDQDTLDFNLREVHDQIYAEAESGDNVIVRISPGVKVGSSSSASPAFTVGDWAAGVSISITNNGRLQGKGGSGNVAVPSEDGGVALYTRYAIAFDNTDGEIWGGGGGGGGKVHVPSSGSPSFWMGGGGAGYLPGNPDGTTESGGPGTGGGVGGDPGQNGGTIPGGQPAGSAGAAVDGNSFVTFSAEGDILGPRVN